MDIFLNKFSYNTGVLLRRACDGTVISPDLGNVSAVVADGMHFTATLALQLKHLILIVLPLLLK